MPHNSTTQLHLLQSTQNRFRRKKIIQKVGVQMKKLNSMISVILISAGAISLAMAAVNEIPAIWSFIQPWLRPPYLHVVINVIIIAIAAASCSRRSQTAPPVRYPPPPAAYYAAYSSPPEVREAVEVPEAEVVAYERVDRVVEVKPVMVNGFEVGADAEEDGSEDAVDGSTLTYNTPPSPERFSPEFQLEYFPPENPTGNILERESTWKKTGEEASRATHEEVRHGGERRLLPDRHRFNNRKSKSFKERSVGYDAPPSRTAASPSRNNLNRRVEADRSSMRNSPPPQNPVGNIPPRFEEAEEEHLTMESAWKKITERGSASRASVDYVGPAIGILRKSSSFKERGVYNDSASSSGLRKEESPSQDELNRRVEAFIKKVNEEIRLRRQNSSNQYIQLNSAA